jgi:hypothetical protein
MRKMRLDLDGLQVESFATAATAGSRGTVRAHSGLSEYNSCLATCGDPCQTGGASHQITCGVDCTTVTNHDTCENSGYKHCG